MPGCRLASLFAALLVVAAAMAAASLVAPAPAGSCKTDACYKPCVQNCTAAMEGCTARCDGNETCVIGCKKADLSCTFGCLPPKEHCELHCKLDEMGCILNCTDNSTAGVPVAPPCSSCEPVYNACAAACPRNAPPPLQLSRP